MSLLKLQLFARATNPSIAKSALDTFTQPNFEFETATAAAAQAATTAAAAPANRSSSSIQLNAGSMAAPFSVKRQQL